jgi:hypothetical protein
MAQAVKVKAIVGVAAIGMLKIRPTVFAHKVIALERNLTNGLLIGVIRVDRSEATHRPLLVTARADTD